MIHSRPGEFGEGGCKCPELPQVSSELGEYLKDYSTLNLLGFKKWTDHIRFRKSSELVRAESWENTQGKGAYMPTLVFSFPWWPPVAISVRVRMLG